MHFSGEWCSAQSDQTCDTVSNYTALIKNIAFVASVLATSLTTFMSTFKYKEERLITHQTLNFLKEFRAKACLKMSQMEDDPENIIVGKQETDELYGEFQSILSKGNLSWRQLMKTSPKKAEQAAPAAGQKK